MNFRTTVTDQDIWQELRQTSRPVIIYGTGNGADKIMDELARLSIPVKGVIASDGFVRERQFRGFPVRSLQSMEQEWENPVILIAFGSQRKDVMEQILTLSRRHTVRCPDVPVYGDQIFNRKFMETHLDELQEVYEHLSDSQSRKVFSQVINFKLSGELSCLTACFSDKQEVFDKILRLGTQENYLDLGAYRGDTIEEFLSHTDGHYHQITALEPDRKTFLKLREYAASLRNIQLFNMGIWQEDTDLLFDASQGRGSSLRTTGKQSIAVTAIDTLYRRRPVSYIKADVEGAEAQALQGGAMVLRRDRPKLNLALYHRSEDLFQLPLLLLRICPDYDLYLRQHPHIPAWDLNLYAVSNGT